MSRSLLLSFILCFVMSESATALAASDAAAAGATSNTSPQEGDVLALPPTDPDNKEIPSIKLGETIRFEEMGPVILNTDGTTRRIDNWDQLSEREKEVTWRRISKRNEERRKMLLQKQQEEQEAKEL